MSQLTRLIGHGAQQRSFDRFLSYSLTTKSNARCLFDGIIWSRRNRDLAPPQWTTTAATRYLPSPWLFTRKKCISHKSAQPTPAPVATNNSDIKASSTMATDLFGDAANMGLFARFKHMYKQYWYVLIPVHCVTSVGWFGGFYYLSKCGVDVPSLLQYMHLSILSHSDMGHYAIAFLCYKVATPLRYALTLGGTTVSIRYLVQWGLIKPIPTKNKLIKKYEEKKATRAIAKAEKDKKDGTE
ncbi:uncharacterized protein C18orf19 homolog A-like [Drosophila miranda]|uniref:uncharacterized protein C18orf19 homolog A-like n=1 Tax=Drosophila miranda TaxID=7229 RepID=UPI00143F5DEF|nr:uncharacterized protein C18orf19 homolog A-like [Drosophila miranda]